MSVSELTQSFIAEHQSSDDNALAVALVTTAGQLAEKMRRDGLTTDTKTSISDVVTEADRAAETFVAEALATLRPDDGVLGEEGAQKASRSNRTWVIDPVDGTYNFTSNLDYFCSAVALIEGDPNNPDAILFGAVHRPETNTTWCGGPKVPTTENGTQVPKLIDAPAAQISLATYLHPPFFNDHSVVGPWQAVVTRFAALRMFGAGSVDLSLVATGRVGAWTQHTVSAWDWLPGQALVLGAGGSAEKVRAGSKVWCVAGNAQAVAEIREALLGSEK